MSTATIAPRGIASGTQTAICLLLAAAVCAGFGMVDLAARSDAINDWFVKRQLAKWQGSNSKFQYNRGYIDFEGRLIYGELPTADYSQGGAYFVGSSNVKNSLLFWELPPAEQKLIHNYALSGAGPREWELWIPYLVEHNNLLQAGGEKTTIIFGLFFDSFSGRPSALNKGLIRAMFTRHGLFDYTDERILPARLNAVEKVVLTEKARCANFLHFAFGHVAFRSKPLLSEAQKKAYYELYAHEPMPDYSIDFAAFENLVKYLQARHVNVRAYFVPLGSWFTGKYGELPMVPEFHRRATEFCAKYDIKLVDLETLLTDDEFFDAAHANYAGQKKMDPDLVKMARDALAETGVLPRDPSGAQQPAGEAIPATP